MDSLLFYLFIGVIWLIQYIVKKKQEAERGQRPESHEPERNIFEEFKDLLEKGRQADTQSYPKPPDLFEQAKQKIESRNAESVEEQETDEAETVEAEETTEPEFEEPALTQPRLKEALIKKILDKYKPEAVLPLPQVETSPSYDFLDNLSNETLEQGIILSTVLGPPKSIQMMKRIGIRNIISNNY